MNEKKFPIYSQTCGMNPVKNLKVNEDGSIEVVLGRFGVPSSDGLTLEWPTDPDVLERIMKRLTTGTLCGEHRPNSGLHGGDGLHGLDLIKRQMVIKDDYVTHVIESAVRQEIGDGVSLALGRIKPFGPLKHLILQEMEKENGRLCFGLRSFTDRKGKLKFVEDLVTFDLVTSRA